MYLGLQTNVPVYQAMACSVTLHGELARGFRPSVISLHDELARVFRLGATWGDRQTYLANVCTLQNY